MCRKLIASYVRYRFTAGSVSEPVVVEHDRTVTAEPSVGLKPARTDLERRSEGLESVVGTLGATAVREPEDPARVLAHAGSQ
jgi:hypothetical protein